MSLAADATSERLVTQLYEAERKAEIVDGRIAMMSPTGDLPSSAGLAIVVRLREYAKREGGRAYTDNVAYLVDLPNRKSFSPDASYFTGPRSGMKFLVGPPVFAVEIRSESDYGPAAERRMAEKRADYFAAGTKVVWDIDLLNDNVVRVFRTGSPEQPVIYRKGETAEAEPAVPGWTFSLTELFD